MALNVGINGFGRIGRIVFRSCLQNSNLKVSAINDPAVDIEYICYLIKFDSTHGKFRGTIERSDNEVIVDGHKIAVYREKLPTNIPWHVADVQYVVEASGMFTSLEKASGHLASDGVKRVIVTAPSLDVPMVILGVNDDQLNSGHKVISCASSTLYCLAPIINILEENFGVSEGFITSIHAMTPSLKPLDGLCLKGKHWRDHRSIHQNIIPATTGACRALGKIIPQVKDKLTGLAFRVPIANVSILDLTIRLKTNTTMVDIVRYVENAEKNNMKSIIKVSNEQAVSSDFIGDTYSCILDLNSSLQLTPDFFKLICWYENEYSYACRVMDSIFFLESQYQLEWNSKLAYIRPTPKQSMIHQTNYHRRIIYHENCRYDYSNSNDPLSVCSTSQDSGFKSPKKTSVIKKPSPSCNSGTSTSQDSGFKSQKKTSVIKKPLPSRNSGTRPMPHVSRELKKKNEFFKIWNDDDDIVRTPLRHNRCSFFHSCMAITPQNKDNDLYVNTKERLDNVKKEITKMVRMTESLLKKSQHSSIEKGLTEKPSKDEAGDSNNNNFKTYEEEKQHLNTKVCCDAIMSNHNKKCGTLQKDESNNNKALITQKFELKKHKNINKSTLSSRGSSGLPVPIKNKSTFLASTSKTSENCVNNECILDNCQVQIHDISNILKENSQIEKIQTLMDSPETNSHNETKECEHFGIITFKNSSTPLKCHQQEGNNIKNKNKTLNEDCKSERDIFYSVSNISTSLIDTSQNDYDKDVSKKEDVKAQDIENKDAEHPVIDKRQEDNRHTGQSLKERFEVVLKKLAINGDGTSEKPSIYGPNGGNTAATISNRYVKDKNDIYDKLDSVSATDSENSFHMNERKSQVINITDLTNSLEDLERLDKICRIMEISDDLSDQLLSGLNNTDHKEIQSNKWSFKNLCEKIKLDDFCNKMFSKSNV